MHLELPLPLTFTPLEKIDFLFQSLSHTPNSEWVRVELAELLLLMDRFDDVLNVLRGHDFTNTWQYRARMIEGNVWLNKEVDREAATAFTAADAAALTTRAHARALAGLGKALVRIGDTERARRVFEQALKADPANPDAQKRLTALNLREECEAEALRRCDALIRQGVLNSRLLADRYLALAVLGRAKEAQEQEGLDIFFQSTELEPPPSWDSIDSFNADLLDEVARHTALRFERFGTASTASWRIDNPLLKRSRVFPALLELIRREILRQVERMGPDHPLRRSKPERALLHPWCVLAQGPGHELWHMHQNAWISGVYYVAVPEVVRFSSDNCGCIEFGNPELSHIPRAIPGERRTFRPKPGRLLMFPSHAYHRTYPSDSQEHRLAVAFDVIPFTN